MSGETTRRRVLLVEDDPCIRVLLERLLEGVFEVEVRGRGDEGLACAVASPFDAVLTDVRMPGLDGLSMAHELRSRGSVVPFLFCTGSPESVTRARLAALQPARLLVKPCDFDELRAALRELGL